MTNPTEFGARGDGCSDDSASLQRALDEGDGDVRLAPGTYRLTRPLEMRLDGGRRSLSGSGGTARLLAAGPGPAVRLLGTHRGNADPKQTAGDAADRERMPTLIDVEIAGEHPEADGVEIAFAWQPTLRGVLVQRCRHGIHVIESNRNVLISDCHLYNNHGAGIFLDGVNLHQVNILGSHVNYNRRGRIRVWHSEIRNLQIAGNDIEYNFDTAAEVSADVWIETGERSIREGAITGNTIQALPSPGGANIRMVGQSAAAGHKAGLFSIAGNLISSQETNVYLQWARGVALSGNTLFGGHRCGVHAVQCSRLLLSGDVFDHNPDYAPDTLDGILLEECEGIVLNGLLLAETLSGTPDAGGAVDLRGCRNASITGCQILNPRHRGISLDHCDRVLISGCVIADDRPERTLVEAIRDGGSRRVSITGCLT